MRTTPPRPQKVLACLALCGVALACSPGEFEGRVSQAKADQARLYDGQFPYRPPTEVEKIERLIDFVRKSDGVYYRRQRALTPGLAAAWMERRYFTRWGRKIRTASRFVGIVSERPLAASRPFIFRASNGQETLVRTLLFEELRRLEATPDRVVDTIMDPRDVPPPPPRQSGKAPTHPIERTIEIIEGAADGVLFVTTDRKGDERLQTGAEFATGLRRKTKWLGADISDVDEWIEKIATRNFVSYQPLLVEIDAQARVPLNTWIRRARASVPQAPAAKRSP